ncbi:SPOR domain-containing protein [Paraburkholderia sp. NMBU_R16]|uniref:SPOR domain-containing protein n=1 Tax=Paraburkholderia sp. NMBU_R16 TaxID=2698676 RepID=UPI0015655FDF|nr:SPOR domain-containing protein [Paraburkholderia sp. NMBU_R16]NRO96150.1 SPOR domain-containing protein [Paraburkholderia sp. NMBU_R16]
MGLFSFGNKDDAPRRRGANVRSARTEGSRRRTERAADADAMLLDPTLPEKQRARRRLVGAIALVIAAVVVLPMVLDSHPRPVTDDIAIDIPNRPATVPSHANDDAAGKHDVPADVAPDGESGASAAVASSPAARSGETGGSDKSTASDKSDKAAQPPVKSAGAMPQTARSQGSSKAAGSAAKTSSGKEATDATNATANEPNSGSAAPGARFAVQLGVFADDANAKRWESKLKAAGVPAYVEHRKQADGSTRSMLRAGPFADRAAASAAIAKVRQAGLTANSAQ